MELFKVKIKGVRELRKSKDYTEELDEYAGETSEVIRKYTGNTRREFYKLTVDDGYWAWGMDMVDLIEPSHSITITSDRHRKTTATYNGKSAVAKCNPSDTFDIFKGTKLALERLEAAENFKPHLECQGKSYGVLGTPTKIKDELGIPLKIGDITTVYDKYHQSNCGDGVIINDGSGDYVSGIRYACNKDGTIYSEWLIIKKQSHNEVTEDEVDEYRYIRTPRLS
jgi:hypothetical protein